MKKLFVLLLAVCMLLSAIPAMSLSSFADREFVITPYENYPISGFENWKGKNGMQTQLLICTQDFPQGIDYSIPWEITFNGRDTIVRCPDSGSGHWLYRFEICTGDDRFIPEVGRNYTVSVRVEVDGVVYTAESDGFIPFQDPIIPDDNGGNNGDTPVNPVDTQQVYLSPLFTHFENWENSPNKGDEWAVTQLLVGITDEYGQAVDIPFDLEWELLIYGEDGSEYCGLVTPATKALVYDGLYRFEICLADEPFVPRYGVQYAVGIDVYEGDVHYYHGEVTEGFICLIDPIVPEGDDDYVGGMDMDLEITAELSQFKNVVVDGEEVTRLGLMVWRGDKAFVAPKDAYWCLRIARADDLSTIQYIDLEPVESSNGYYYFEPVYAMDLMGDYFIPEQDVLYTVGIEIYDEDMNILHCSANSSPILCDVEPIIPDIFDWEDMYDLTLEAGKPAWQWVEKNGKKVLTLTFKITDAEGKAVNIEDEWELAIAPEDAEEGAMLTLTPVSVKNGVYVFEIPAKEFTPEKGVDYLVMAYIINYETGEAHMSMPTEGFLYNLTEEDDAASGNVDESKPQKGDEKDEKEDKTDEAEKEEGISALVIILISVGGTLAVVAIVATVIVIIKKKRT